VASVCGVCVCAFKKRLPNFVVCTHIVYGSRSACTDIEVKRSKVKGQGHDNDLMIIKCAASVLVLKVDIASYESC